MIDCTVTLGDRRDLELSADVCERLGLAPADSLRLVERDGMLVLVPLNQAIDHDRLDELARWQAASLEAIARFPWDESEP